MSDLVNIEGALGDYCSTNTGEFNQWQLRIQL